MDWLDGQQSRFGRFEEEKNLLSMSGFDPQTEQPAPCRYTNYATPASLYVQGVS
jgi:hypothetical protein